jgi:hypothetical protein
MAGIGQMLIFWVQPSKVSNRTPAWARRDGLRLINVIFPWALTERDA